MKIPINPNHLESLVVSVLRQFQDNLMDGALRGCKIFCVNGQIGFKSDTKE